MEDKGCSEGEGGKIKSMDNKKKSQYDFARELHLVFASVGGGLHLAIFTFRIYEFSQNPHVVHDFILVGIQIVTTILVWWRMYWVYLNTLVFFAPFDNPKIFFNDLMAFFSGSLTLFFLGNTSGWFLIGGISLIVCRRRIQYTLRRSEERYFTYPNSVERFRKIHHTFPSLMVIPILYAAFGGLFLGWLQDIWYNGDVVICLIFLLICCPVFLYSFDPFYPLKKDIQ